MATFFTPNQIARMAASDLLRDLDLTGEELLYLLDLAAEVKSSPRDYAQVLAGKSIALLFEKPSLRTRLTFELAIKQLGGDSVFVEGPVGGREPIKDVARNLDRWVNGIVARVFAQTTADELAGWSSAPVINALSDQFHPCQALADMLTLKEKFGRLRGLKLAFVGDGNNVANSLMLNAARLGMDFALACPKGYEPDPEIVLEGAHAVYTDVWASMGQEKEASQRRRAFEPYRVDPNLFAMARPDAVFMHCLPAHRGEEVTDAVMEHERSVIFDQAENRLHAQKALLLMMLA
jgi:ornithine carbamoyltransferase